MKSSKIRVVVVLGIVTIIGIILFQVFWVMKTFDLKEKQFNQTISIALLDVAEKLAAFNKSELPKASPVSQLSSTYFVVNVNSIIDAKILENFLIAEFSYRNIQIDFEYAIYDCSDDKMVYGGYISHAEDKEHVNTEKILPKHDKYMYYFGVNFPTKTIYILSNLNVWMVSSLILILTCIFFGYAIYTILDQRRFTEVQKDFINNMTHEFKTPISTIAISSGVLLKPDIINNPERLRQYAGIISDQNNRLEQHVENVLQVALSERAKIKLIKEPVDLHELLKQVSDSAKANCTEKKLSLILDLQARNSLITAERSHLSNVIYNLINNAIKYSGDDLVIRISTAATGKTLTLSFEDNGIGISRKYVKKVFRKFFRVPTGNVHTIKGFGLGLSYVENIIKAHRWKIKLESKENVGSRFIITIPEGKGR